MIISRTSGILGDKRMSVRDMAKGAGISYGSAYGLYSANAKRYGEDVLNRVCGCLRVHLCGLLEYSADAAVDTEGKDT